MTKCLDLTGYVIIEMMFKNRFIKFLGLLIPIFFIILIGFVYNYTSRFLFYPYIDSADLYYLFAPAGIFQLHYPFTIGLVILIISIFVTLSIYRETKKVGLPLAFAVVIVGSLIGFMIFMGDHINSAKFVFMSSLGQLSLIVLLPALIILPILIYLFRKMNMNEYAGIFSIAILLLLVNIIYINTCGFGNNEKCLLRKEIKKFNVAACENPILHTFEKNDCYILISSYSGNTSLCSNLVTYDKNSGTSWSMNDCMNKKKYDHNLLYQY